MSRVWHNPDLPHHDITLLYEQPLCLKPLLPKNSIFKTAINSPMVGGRTMVWVFVANGVGVAHSLS